MAVLSLLVDLSAQREEGSRIDFEMQIEMGNGGLGGDQT